MQVPEELRRCVVFLGYKDEITEEYVTIGTAFLVGRQLGSDTVTHVTLLVTAGHVIRGPAMRGVKTIYVRKNVKGGGAVWIPTAVDEWCFHPTRPEVDVAIAPAMLGEGEHDHLSIPDTMFLTRSVMEEQRISPGDDVCIIGLFQPHHGRDRNIPIVRTGTLASLDEEPVATVVGTFPAYLIEARSIGGLSGSPVFFYTGLIRHKKEGVAFGSDRPFYLGGLINGHFDVREESLEKSLDKRMPASEREARINMGIAIVVPWFDILEVWNQQKFVEIERQQDRKRRSEEFMQAQLEQLAAFRPENAILKETKDENRDTLSNLELNSAEFNYERTDPLYGFPLKLDDLLSGIIPRERRDEG